MKLSEILSGVEIKDARVGMGVEITGITCDSRKVKPGDVFVAIRGYESDGHMYIAAALTSGAVCIICEEPPEENGPYITAENTRRALSVMAANFYGRPADKMKIIGVTGTNGKTTTTNLLKTIIEDATGAKVGLIGTNRNMVGNTEIKTERTTPEASELQALFSQMYSVGCEYVIMEVSSHALFLDRVYGVMFEVGVFTNLTTDHLDFHKSMEAYGMAKSILFSQCRKGVVNMDDDYSGNIMASAKCPVFTYSAENTEADLSAKSIDLKPDGVTFVALMTGTLEKIHLGIPGMFSVYNALAAASAALQLDITLGAASNALSRCKGVMGRAEVVPTGGNYTVLIDYAHTPDALQNIIKAAKGFSRGRVVTLFGCGGDRDKTKRPVMGRIAMELSDFVIITSDNPRTEEPSAIIADIIKGTEGLKTPHIVIENRKEAIGWAISNARPNDTIILAGKGHETYQVIGREKHHFDEREIIAEILK
ncbi:MAG: UDP-N-acetylmuramoyl-L-alanyl-D-glutamate--2,6-diaminopimelate ligase [Oscillospiraceae bacterium]